MNAKYIALEVKSIYGNKTAVVRVKKLVNYLTRVYNKIEAGYPMSEAEPYIQEVLDYSYCNNCAISKAQYDRLERLFPNGYQVVGLTPKF